MSAFMDYLPELLGGSAALFVAGLAQGCTGFGLALLAAPCLLVFMPPVCVVPTVLILSTPNTFLVAYDGRHRLQPSLAGPIALGGVMGMPIGITALRAIPDVWLKLGVGTFVILFAALLLVGWRKPLPPMRRAATFISRWCIGVFSGTLGGATSMGGPPVVMFLANEGTPKDVFRANITAHFFIMNLAGLSILIYQDMLTQTILLKALALVPAMLLGTHTGVRLSRRVSQGWFERIVMGGVFLAGVALLARTIGSLAS